MMGKASHRFDETVSNDLETVTLVEAQRRVPGIGPDQPNASFAAMCHPRFEKDASEPRVLPRHARGHSPNLDRVEGSVVHPGSGHPGTDGDDSSLGIDGSEVEGPRFVIAVEFDPSIGHSHAQDSASQRSHVFCGDEMDLGCSIVVDQDSRG